MSDRDMFNVPGVGGAGSSLVVATWWTGAGVFSGPVPAVSMALSVVAVAAQRRWPWRRVAVVVASVLIVAEVVAALVGYNPVALTLGGWVTQSPTDWALVLPISVPFGALCGCGVFGVAEAQAVGAEWHPLERRRMQIAARKELRRIGRAAKNRKAQARCSSPPLGVARDGDLRSWHEGDYAVVNPAARNLGIATVGTTGAGKSVTLTRLAQVAGYRNQRLIFVDCKGTDTSLATSVVAAYMAGVGSPEVAVRTWPDNPIDGWRGAPSDIVNRLLATQVASEPFYESILSTAVRLAVTGPSVAGYESCRSSTEFMARLSLAYMAAAADGCPELLGDYQAIKRSPQLLDGVRLRYSGFFSALAGRFDGWASYGDAQVTVLTVPTLAGQADSEAAVRMLLADLSQYCADPSRKAREGDDVVMMIDEFSAVTGSAPEVINLAERVRDVGGQVIVAAQSWEGLGADDDERQRLLGALPGGLILHKTVSPDRLCEVAGTDRRVEQSWQLDEVNHSGMGSMREGFRMKVSPDAVRRASVGEAWVIAEGEYLHMHVLRSDRGFLAEASQRVAFGPRTPTTTIGVAAFPPGRIDPPDFLDDLNS